VIADRSDPVFVVSVTSRQRGFSLRLAHGRWHGTVPALGSPPCPHHARRQKATAEAMTGIQIFAAIVVCIDIAVVVATLAWPEPREMGPGDSLGTTTAPSRSSAPSLRFRGRPRLIPARVDTVSHPGRCGRRETNKSRANVPAR
jgi:hypothetical protein